MTVAHLRVVRDVARPFLKWAGGKAKLLPEILPRLPAKIRTYHEPFIGGGAVFFALAAEHRFEHASISDVNEELVLTYRGVAIDVATVIQALGEHERGHDEARFYAIRALDPEKLSLALRAARVIYLNRTCFNGLYRVNRAGKFNTPFGAYKNPTICDAENLRSVSALLRERTSIDSGDFELAVEDALRGDAVYFDPPYVPASKTANFTGYAKAGFGMGEQERLRNLAEKLDARGVHVLLSNADTPEVRELYDGFNVTSVTAPRAINSKGGKRGAVGEVLISRRKA